MKITGMSAADMKQIRDVIDSHLRRDRRPPADTPDQDVIESWLQDQFREILAQDETQKGADAAKVAARDKYKGKQF